MSKKRRGKRYPRKKDVTGRRYCRVCGVLMEDKRKWYCSPECKREFKLHTDWKYVREIIWKRDGGICQICNKKIRKSNYHCDHIKPYSLYPKIRWELTNLQVSCASCNLRKGNK